MVKNNSEYLEDSRYLKLATIGVMNYNICMMTKDTDINNLASTPFNTIMWDCDKQITKANNTH